MPRHQITFDRLPTSLRVRRVAGALFVFLLIAWTWKLIEPSPLPEGVLDVLESFSTFAKFLMAKCLHAGGYATLAFLGCVWMRMSGQRWGIVAFLILHGIATEAAQHLLEWGRTGKVVDVAIDWAGTVAGVVAWGRWTSQVPVTESGEVCKDREPPQLM